MLIIDFLTSMCYFELTKNPSLAEMTYYIFEIFPYIFIVRIVYVFSWTHSLRERHLTPTAEPYADGQMSGPSA